MRAPERRALIHALFDVSLIGKGLDGLLEIVGGILLAVVSPEQMNTLVRALTQHELSEDPGDFVAGLLVRSTRHLMHDARVFAVVFLLSHGVIKIVLVRALLTRRLRAYPAAIALFGGFLLYQVYRFTLNGSPWLLALSVLDVAVIVLTWLEYRRLVGLTVQP